MKERKTKPVDEKKAARIQIYVTTEQQAKVAQMLATLGGKTTASDLFRRAIDALEEQLAREMTGLETLELQMSGDPDILAKKQLAIKAFGYLANVPLVAERVGVTSRTIYYWLESDAVFNQLAEEAQARTVGMVEGALFKKAMDGHVSAMFGILNARHPDYGQIRNQMIQVHLAGVVDAILNVAHRFVPSDAWDRFTEAVGECVTEATRGLGKGQAKRKRV